MARGRKSKLADPEFARRVAELYVSGMDYKDMAVQLECHVDTVTDWVRDPRVRVVAKELSDQRTLATTRMIDAEFERRLLDPEAIKKMDTETLIKMRKELMGRVPDDDVNDDDVEAGLWSLMDDNPELAAALNKAMGDA